MESELTIPAALAIALQLQQGGDTARAAELYEQILKIEPGNVNALHLLGVTVSELGDLDRSVDLIRRAVAIAPDQAPFHTNLGRSEASRGHYGAAVEAFERALALGPESADNQNNLAFALLASGRHGQAAATARRALDMTPDHPEALVNLSGALQGLGQYDEALEAAAKAVELNAGLAMAHYNMGCTLQKLDRMDEAIEAYRAAIEADPGDHRSHHNLALALAGQDRDQEALPHFQRAVGIAPGNAGYWHAYAGFMGDSKALAYDDALVADLLSCLENPDVAPQQLQPAVFRFLDQQGRIAKLHELAENPDALGHALASPGVADELFHPVLLAYLENGLVTVIVFERILTAARARLLGMVVDGKKPPGGAQLQLMHALAHQCFLNEYVYPEPAAEAARVGLLLARVKNQWAAGETPPATDLACLAMYRPLHELPFAADLAAKPEAAADTPLAKIIRRQIAEPLEERKLAANIQALTGIADGVSQKVRAQYEDNPYPRWQRMERVEPKPASVVLTDLIPGLAGAGVEWPQRPEILVAGCGTGWQPIRTALTYANSRVLGLDLSVASLCYATRKAREMGVENIEFVQADILELGSLERRFDIVECIGVLHHLEDPERGWGILTELLTGGGFMRVGLYSELARHDVAGAREFIAERGFKADAEGIRACRQEIMAADETFSTLTATGSVDFFSMSACRDCIFHVHEQRFTIPRIATALESLNLEFLGFEGLPADRMRDYREAFPGDPPATSLANWQAFEESNPDLFAQLYRFWLRKREVKN